MTLPAQPPMTIGQMAAEFGLGVGCVFPRDFYGKGGAPSAGNLSFSDFLGRSGATFNPVPGTYSANGVDFASRTLSCSVPCVWTYAKRTGGASQGTVGEASGSSSTSIEFDLTSKSGTHLTDPTIATGCTWDVTATVGGQTYAFVVQLSCSGGTAGGSN